MYHKHFWNTSRWCWTFRFSHANVQLIEYSSNYFEAAGSLWFQFKNKATSFSADIANDILNGQSIVFSPQLVLIILIVLILIILFLLPKRQNYMFL